MRCLEKDPEKRFQNGEEVAGALGQIMTGGESVAGKSAAAPGKSRFFSLSILLLVILIVVGGGLAYYFSRPQPFPPPGPPPAPVEKVKPAFLKVESAPEGAQIFIDGSFKGNTPTRMELPSGKHEVRLVLSEYYDWEAQVELKEEGELPLAVKLAPISERKP